MRQLSIKLRDQTLLTVYTKGIEPSAAINKINNTIGDILVITDETDQLLSALDAAEKTFIDASFAEADAKTRKGAASLAYNQANSAKTLAYMRLRDKENEIRDARAQPNDEVENSPEWEQRNAEIGLAVSNLIAELEILQGQHKNAVAAEKLADEQLTQAEAQHAATLAAKEKAQAIFDAAEDAAQFVR